MVKKSNRINHWRLNVIATYFDELNKNQYRPDVLHLLTGLASIYKLDYAIFEGHQFSGDSDLAGGIFENCINDLVYLRSNKNSMVSAKMLRSLIRDMFQPLPSLFEVEVSTQLYKVLPQYPFPNEFYRPLNYPFVEFHKGSQKTILIFADEVMKVIEKEQDYPLN